MVPDRALTPQRLAAELDSLLHLDSNPAGRAAGRSAGSRTVPNRSSTAGPGGVERRIPFQDIRRAGLEGGTHMPRDHQAASAIVDEIWQMLGRL